MNGLIVSAGFWALMILAQPIFILLFALFYAGFLWMHTGQKIILIVWIGCVMTALWLTRPAGGVPQAGLYTIREIRNHYCLGTRGEQSIVLYGLEQAGYYDEVFVENIEPIESLNNKNVFNFQSWMHQQHIDYQANVTDKDIAVHSRSLKNRVYQRLKKYSVYQMIFYQQFSDEIPDLIFQLGLPVLGLFADLKKGLRRLLSKTWADGIHVLCMCAYMIVFPLPISLLRYFLFSLARMRFSRFEHRMSVSLFLFLCLKPQQASAFSLVFPVLLQIIYRYCDSFLHRFIWSKALLVLCQSFYFHTIDVVSLIGFGMLRKIYHGIALCSLIPFLRVWAPSFFDGFQYMLQSLPSLRYGYTPGFLCFLLLFLYGVYKKKILLILCCLMPVAESRIDPFFHVYMLDVGQGDCTLIVEPFRRSAVMIDCAGNLYRDNVKEIVMPVLDSFQIRQLDALVVTHDDFDHSGGVKALCKEIPVKSVITKRDQVPDVDYPFLSVLEHRQAKDENDKSIVSYFSYDGFTYCWTGDAGVEVEQQILQTYDLKADVLKLGHHGSDTSSSFEFLDALRPKLGLVSVGAHNRYRHPSSQVISRCHQLGIQTLQTSRNGMIHLFSWRRSLFFECADGLFGIIQL